MTTTTNIIKEAASWYFNENIIVHITYFNGHWCRGKILEVNDFFIVLDELKAGRILISFEDIMAIEKYTPKEAKEDGGTKHKPVAGYLYPCSASFQAHQ